ncbi:lasso peptide isopeptide bond-forming cyclase [Fredinandcohnia sp. 179-A 10B2 NHS]|uniref:lasso peptide isopeptide bond-forming cyclase n=1 Tax=Fredinandcohnia sp. 179-A 10B2 NHS TaxID=3235176 RepID=UPI0039A11AD1
MSAIAGIYNGINESVIENGSTLMKYLQRFPADDIKTWHQDNVFLGCHAQWITPESINERLPYYDSESRVTITADAIIDNRDELFEKLQVSRYERETVSDSQLILLAYLKWGQDSAKFLIGDFAFMIWDEKKQMLFGARDFSGSRTLYYYNDDKRFAFCTVIEPLLMLPYVNKRLNESWLAEFLAITTVVDTVDTSNTAYQGINQVPPSHSIVIKENKVSINRYCYVPTGEKLKLKANDEYVEAFQEVFQKAVRSRLRTFRGVGSHLSGGLDSGAVVSFAAKDLQEKALNTFSYIPSNDFEDYTPKYLLPNETPLIKSTVEYVGGIKSHYLDFDGRNPYMEIDDFLATNELPYKFFENSFWIKGIFEKAHKENVGVLLSGGRGNLSISWGSALDYYSLLLKGLRWSRLIKELNYYSQNVGGARMRRLPVITRVAFPFLDQLFSKPYYVPSLINSKFAKRTGVLDKLRQHGIDETGWYSTTNIFEHRKKHFEEVFHWNATNTLSTKLSLRYSVWKRDPTNDIRVIRYCLSIPEEQYVQNGLDRALIRRATKNYLPDTVRLNQRYKGVQGADWVHRMKPYWTSFLKEARELALDNRMQEYIDGGVFKQGLLKAEEGALPRFATDPDIRNLMRSVVLYRFINTFT